MVHAPPAEHFPREGPSLTEPSLTSWTVVLQAETFFDEACVGPAVYIVQRFLTPICHQIRQGAKWVRCQWRSQEPAQEVCNHAILLRLRTSTKDVSRFATLNQHRTETLIRINETHCGISVPETKTLNFVLSLHA